eukprot:COSAG04_NODE_230_length_19216_cov_15.830787_12_plen_362_part_00
MSDMIITQAAGSRNYSLHWRDGHGTWAGNHSVSRHDIDAIWVCILLKMPAMIVRTGRDTCAPDCAGLHGRESHHDAGKTHDYCWCLGLHCYKSASNDRADRNRTRHTSIGASISLARSPRRTTRAGRRKGRGRTAPGSLSARHAAHPRELGPTVAASPTPPARPLLRSTPAPMLFSRRRTRQTASLRGSCTGASTPTALTSRPRRRRQDRPHPHRRACPTVPPSPRGRYASAGRTQRRAALVTATRALASAGTAGAVAHAPAAEPARNACRMARHHRRRRRQAPTPTASQGSLRRSSAPAASSARTVGSRRAPVRRHHHHPRLHLGPRRRHSSTSPVSWALPFLSSGLAATTATAACARAA